jgi:nucleotide-binding universal stress UspA family protein
MKVKDVMLKGTTSVASSTPVSDIVVNLPLRGERDTTTTFAASLAGYFNAHLTGVAFIYEPVIVAVELGVDDARFIEEQDVEAKRNAQAAIDRLEFEIRRENVSWATHQIGCSSVDASSRFAEIARGFDLAVVSQADPKRSNVDDLIVEATLFESGRPTLIVPYIQAPPFKLDRIAICWDRSRPATRAIADSMPFLKRAHSIDLISIVGDSAPRNELVGADMAEHLSRHGLKIDIKQLQGASDVPSTILNFVSDTATDLLVMSGYGHSRLREFVLGGATRGILQSMTVPTLMSH